MKKTSKRKGNRGFSAYTNLVSSYKTKKTSVAVDTPTG